MTKPPQSGSLIDALTDYRDAYKDEPELGHDIARFENESGVVPPDNPEDDP